MADDVNQELEELVTESNTVKMRFSFEDELTFAPKLNSYSRKIASEIKRTSIYDRRKQPKKEYENEDFIFKPVVSTKSSKIVAKLKTGFFDRQNKHVQKQKELLNYSHHVTLNTPVSHLSNKAQNENKSKKIQTSISLSTSVKISDDIKDSGIIEVFSRSDESLMKKTQDFNSFMRKTQEPIYERTPNKTSYNEENEKLKLPSPNNSKDSMTISPGKVRKKVHFRKIEESNDDIKMEEEKEKKKKKHKRCLTYPQGCSKARTDVLDENYQQLLKAKLIVGEAIRNKKIFLCNGPYKSLRQALRQRGWIEKNFKADPTLKSEKENSDEDKLESDQTESDKMNPSQMFAKDDQYGIMSRIARNSTPSFIWTLKRDDIDFKYLRKDQIVNHYVSAWAFTTKSGLCTNLRNVHYFEDTTSNTFFPRCYRLCCDDEKHSFVDDYRITATQGILKVLIKNCYEWRKIEHLKNNANHSKKENAQGDEDNDTQKDSPRNIRKKEDPTLLSINVLSLTLKACYSYLDNKEHRDIEESYSEIENGMNLLTWNSLINHYYSISRGDAIISNAWQHLEECKDVLKKMECYCSQMKIDGYRNIWILKPGAKSRGRGIEIKNRLNDILNLTSDNVFKKENRWVIQKYIEQPYLVYRTKFDIRQWFLVTDWNPLMLWFYQDCYIRFCGQEFTLENFEAQYHLSNNSVQKHYKNGERSEHLPDSNMWNSDQFKKHLLKKGHRNAWDEIIYPGMKKAIIASLLSCQDSLEFRKNSFELYGADFMLSEDLKPWLIEINSSPALGASTEVTEVLCNNVIEDTLKIILDRREDKNADIGRFELAFKQPFIPVPNYMGCTLTVEGTGLRPPVAKTKVKPLEKPEDDRGNVRLKNQVDDHANIKIVFSKEKNVSVTDVGINIEPKLENTRISNDESLTQIREWKSNASFPNFDVPIEKIKKRHSKLASLIEELKSDDRLLKQESALLNTVTVTDIIELRKSRDKFGEYPIFDIDTLDTLMKDKVNYVEHNVKRIKSKQDPPLKLKFKKPIKEVKTKVRYSKQFGLPDSYDGDNSKPVLPVYDDSIVKQIHLNSS